MKLIIGLGNPGKKYSKTRHNIGYMIIDKICEMKNIKLKYDSKLNGEIAETNISGIKTVLLKPTTYMNLSGHSVLAVMKYYKINLEDIIVIYDDIDLPVGKIRLRELGGHGGHNGIKHIIQTLGTKDFKRLKIGIDVDKSMPLDNYVLGKFNKDEKTEIEIAIINGAEASLMFVKHDEYKDVMTKYNTQT